RPRRANGQSRGHVGRELRRRGRWVAWGGTPRRLGSSDGDRSASESAKIKKSAANCIAQHSAADTTYLDHPVPPTALRRARKVDAPLSAGGPFWRQEMLGFVRKRRGYTLTVADGRFVQFAPTGPFLADSPARGSQQGDPDCQEYCHGHQCLDREASFVCR